MSAATIAPVSNVSLTQECRHQLATANGRAKKIHKAARVAAFNGWVTGFFAAVSAPFAFFSVSGFLVTAGLILVAYNEFRGRKRLLRFDPTGAALLGWNQIGFLALIAAYCSWMIFSGLTSASPIAAELQAKPELAEAVGSLGQIDLFYKAAIVALYGTILVLSAIFQGLNALYYFTRRDHVEAYVRETPEWVLDVQRMTAGA